MTIEELHVFLSQWYCGCGNPEDASATLLRLLDLHPLHEVKASGQRGYQELDAWIQDDGVRMLLLYMLDRYDLTEHGGSVGGGWLTPKGEDVRDALRRESADNFSTLHDATRCMHGYDVENSTHRCG